MTESDLGDRGWVGGGEGGREIGGRGGGGGGADLCVAHECLSSRAHACRLIKTDQRQCASPFCWTDQPETHYACSLRRQVPGVPSANLIQPQVEEKDCEARPPHLPILRRKVAQSFPSPRRWMPWIRDDIRSCTWTCLPGKPDLFYPYYHLYPKDYQE